MRAALAGGYALAGAVLTITLRDLQWRARRFALGVVATSLVFTTTLLLVGVHASFTDETASTVAAVGADRWVVPEGVSGPFTASSPVGPDVVARVARARGVRSAEPLVAFRHVARVGSDQRVVNVIAVPRGGIVRPRLVAGRPIRSAGEVVADERARFDIGDTFTLGRHRLRVVGLVRNLTYFGGTPTLLLSLGDGRRIAYDGRALASAVITRGVPVGPLPGLRVMDRAAVRDDLMRPMRAATSTIAVLALLLSVVAAGIVGLMTYMSGLDRLVDFAVFKAIGVRTGRLLGGLVLQSLTLALGSALAATVAAIAIKPVFPIVVHLSLATCSMLVGLALLVGLLVSLVSIRQCAHVDPAIAFGRH